MIDQLKSIAIFKETANTGNFRTAAKNLNLSPSVVSYHISQLEEMLGEDLLYRTTRKLSLTRAGEQLLDVANKSLSEMENIWQEISEKKSVPRGRLKIALPSLLAQSPLTKLLTEFNQEYPEVRLDLHYSDNRFNLVEEAFDFALRIGNLKDNNLIRKKLFSIKRILVCSNELLIKYPQTKKLEDLNKLPWICLSVLPQSRTLKMGAKTKKINFQGSIQVDDVVAMTEFCKAGAGVSSPPLFLMKEAIEKAEVTELFPRWKLDSVPVYGVWHQSKQQKPLLNLFKTYLAENSEDI